MAIVNGDVPSFRSFLLIEGPRKDKAIDYPGNGAKRDRRRIELRLLKRIEVQTKWRQEKMRIKSWTLVLGVLCGLIMGQMLVFAAGRETKETFTGSVVGIGGRLGGVVRPFTLTIEGYTSNEEALRFATTLKEKGQEALLQEMQKQKLGRFALNGDVGREINVVREHKTEHGRKITLVFERWLQMFELRYGTRSQDYPFTYAEIYLSDDGKGEGTLIPAAKIYFDDKEENTVAIENFGIYPARLANIELRSR
jgi:hypothetical protein